MALVKEKQDRKLIVQVQYMKCIQEPYSRNDRLFHIKKGMIVCIF
jgi:hypothetical protein